MIDFQEAIIWSIESFKVYELDRGIVLQDTVQNILACLCHHQQNLFVQEKFPETRLLRKIIEFND